MTPTSTVSGTGQGPMAGKSQSSRQVWMDFTRGLCIVLVLMVHARAAITHYAPLEAPDWLFAFNMFLDPFRMPMLMFLSGMLLHKSLGKATRPYVAGKFTQIFWPFLIFSMLILLAEDRLTLLNILKVPISSPTLLWYLWFLVAYYVLALVFVRLRVPLLAVAVVSLALVPVLPEFLRLPRFAYLFFFFLLGHVVMLQLPRLKLGTWTAVLGLGLAVVAGYISVTEGSIKYNAVYIWGPLGMALAMLSLAPLYRPTAATTWLEWIGRNSIVFYVIHFPVQLVAVNLLMTQGGIGTFMPLYVGALVASILVSMLVQMARQRSAGVAALFDFNRLMPSRPGGMLP